MYRLGLLVTLLLGLAAYAGANIVTIYGHSMVPLRSFCSQFGASYDLDPTTNAYSVLLDGRVAYITPYSRVAWIGDNRIELAVAPVIVDDSLYVPLDFFSSAFDFQYSWGSDYNSLVLIDLFSHQRVDWDRDRGWEQRDHRWDHSANYRMNWNYNSSPRTWFQGRSSRPGATGNGHVRNGNSSGGRTPMTGSNPRMNGASTPSFGRTPATSGGHKPMIGKSPSMSNGSIRSSGRTTATTGGRMPSSGRTPAMSSGHMPSTGRSPAMSGGRMPSNGGHSSMSSGRNTSQGSMGAHRDENNRR